MSRDASRIHRQLPSEYNAISLDVIQSAIAVHKALGPGLLERVYQLALQAELVERGRTVRTEIPVEVRYGGEHLGIGYRLDLLVDEKVVVEVKSVEAISEIHLKQVLTYLRITEKRLGLIVNFNEAFVRDGIRRVVN